MKKRAISIISALLMLAIAINSISAINLDITARPIQNSVILELEEPAVYELTITNLGDDDLFEIYSLVGIDVDYDSPLEIKNGETKTITIKLFPQESQRIARELPLNFVYKIRSSLNEIQEETLSINIIGLDSVFTVNPNIINSLSDSIILELKNNINKDFENIAVKFDSAFFEHLTVISLKPKEKKEFAIPLDSDKTRILNAGKYLMNSEIKVNDNTINIESQINFLEQENIETTETREGFLINRIEIMKKNLGNTRKSVEIRIEKKFLSFLFTSFSHDPTELKFENSKRIYTWKKELIPNEELKVIVKTNWLIPLFILIILIAGIIMIRKSIYMDIELLKKVSFVKTKGGQFALKVSLIVKSKSYLERIKIIDKLPPLVKLYDKFGAIYPDEIDLKNRRLTWNIESLNNGESRIFTYIIYSKIGVVGRFELPNARAIYEKEGEVKESVSNRSFYINEPKD